ncbi:MAG: 2-C-methyl-D-erythritol 2,4-cyclodiphosphate synthase [Bacillota bacterium]|nr:MAG: 2-C-methyl-D-erythritol 2,4-cyclodiphosphate synthase [Bacillota bacterium]
MSVGMGFDAHRLTPDRKLILGGVEIAHPLGLLGHSDADVLTHAVMDAILGAAGLRDIGVHFPDNDPAYKDADSVALLRRVWELAAEEGYGLVNLDCTVVAQAPKLSPYFSAMRERLAAALGCRGDRINLKATTTEGMGFAGREEGICALAVCQLEKRHETA